MGVAVFRGGELVDWELRHFKQRWSEVKLDTIIQAVQAVVSRYSPTLIALKASKRSSACAHVQTVTARMHELMAKTQVPFQRVSVERLQKLPTTSRSTMVDALVAQFPVLAPYNRNRLQFLSGYYLKLFEAVAVAYEHAG